MVGRNKRFKLVRRNTPSAATGPNGDHTYENGKHMIEMSVIKKNSQEVIFAEFNLANIRVDISEYRGI